MAFALFIRIGTHRLRLLKLSDFQKITFGISTNFCLILFRYYTLKQTIMAKFLIKASYTPEGVKGLLRGSGTARKQAVEKTINDIGGKLEAFYFAFGDADAYVIISLPDNATAAALALNINASVLVSVTTVALLDPEEVDAAVKMSVNYRAPGS